MTSNLIGAGVLIALYVPDSFAAGAWITAATLLMFAFIGRRLAGNGVS